MGRGAWWATVHGVAELDTTEQQKQQPVLSWFILAAIAAHFRLGSLKTTGISSSLLWRLEV